MSISEEKLAANRANAEHSTGPTTEGGKAKSSQNATTHGLTAEADVLPHENMDEFQRFSAEIISCLDPEGAIESEFARIVAGTQWRLRRIKKIEDGLLSCGEYGATDPESLQEVSSLLDSFTAHPRSLSNLSQHEHRLYRIMTNALKHLTDLQAIRNKYHEDLSAEANHIHNIWRYRTGLFSSPEPPMPSVPSDGLGSFRAAKRAAQIADRNPEPSAQVGGFVFPANEIANETNPPADAGHAPKEDENIAA